MSRNRVSSTLTLSTLGWFSYAEKFSYIEVMLAVVINGYEERRDAILLTFFPLGLILTLFELKYGSRV